MKPREIPSQRPAHAHDEAPGALGNGSRVLKVTSRQDSTHEHGELANVPGSAYHPVSEYGYFVEASYHAGLRGDHGFRSDHGISLFKARG